MARRAGICRRCPSEGRSIRRCAALGQLRYARIRVLLNQNRGSAFLANAFNFSSSPEVSRIDSLTVILPFLTKRFV